MLEERCLIFTGFGADVCESGDSPDSRAQSGTTLTWRGVTFPDTEVIIADFQSITSL